MKGSTFLAVLLILIGLGLMIAGTGGRAAEVMQVLRRE